ncbi:hypothetical protein JCM39068_38970 [Desulfocastanea catecholica]
MIINLTIELLGKSKGKNAFQYKHIKLPAKTNPYLYHERYRINFYLISLQSFLTILRKLEN